MPSKKESPDGIDKPLLAEMEEFMSTLRERSKRTILRKIKQELLTWKDGRFVYKETGEPIENLKFKTDDNDFGDSDSEDEKEEKIEKKNIKENITKNNDSDEFEDIESDDDESENSDNLKKKKNKKGKK